MRLVAVRLLAIDCDGVLTDGGVYMLDDGSEFHRFFIHDGLGLKNVMACGIKVAIISGASAPAITQRARQLCIDTVYTGVDDKLLVLDTLCTQTGFDLKEIAYMGDDLPDLPVLKRVGLACAPANAVEAVKECAALVTKRAGGAGAVRELCDLLVESRGLPRASR